MSCPCAFWFDWLRERRYAWIFKTRSAAMISPTSTQTQLGHSTPWGAARGFSGFLLVAMGAPFATVRWFHKGMAQRFGPGEISGGRRHHVDS